MKDMASLLLANLPLRKFISEDSTRRHKNNASVSCAHTQNTEMCAGIVLSTNILNTYVRTEESVNMDFCITLITIDGDFI